MHLILCTGHSTKNVETGASEIIASRDSFPDNPKTGTFQKQTIQPEILVTRLSEKEMSNIWIFFTMVSSCFGKHSYYCESFEPRSHSKSRLSLIVRVNVVLNRTVVVDSD